MFSFILSIVCGILILIFDQITKFYIISNFKLGQSANFLDRFIEITYIHNRGGAWGMLSGYTGLLLTVTILIMLLCVVLLVKFALNNKLLHWAFSLVIFGGVGNLIDRIFRDGNVIDFLHFEFWPQFPVFNIADCAIVIGACLLILYYIIDTFREIKNKKKISQEKVEDGEV